MEVVDGGQRDGIGIVLFGFGTMGHIHAVNCLQNRRFELLYVVEYDMDKVKQFKEENRLSNLKILHPDNANEALDDTKVNGAIVASVTRTHPSIVLNCLKRGKAVLCEKPIAVEADIIAQCYEEAEKQNLPLLCALNRRFDPSHSKLREDVTNGRIGNVHTIKTCNRDSPIPPISYLKGSSGMFHDCCVHDVDMIMWIVGEKPVTVYAQASAFHGDIAAIGDVDTILVTMKFASGVLANMDLSRASSYGYDQRLEVHGSKGMLESKSVRKTQVCCSDMNGISDDVLHYSFPARFAEAYKRELDHFADVFEGKRPISITKEEVLQACYITRACEESYKTGSVIVLE